MKEKKKYMSVGNFDAKKTYEEIKSKKTPTTHTPVQNMKNRGFNHSDYSNK